MRPETSARLVAINHQFYQTFAQSFSETRARLQPGVTRLIKRLTPDTAILDLGCGNGELAARLAASGHKGIYVGLDFSTELLAAAQAAIEPHLAGKPTSEKPASGMDFTFLQADLAAAEWDAQLPAIPFNAVLAFAVLHHLPGKPMRQRLLSQIRGHLADHGLLYLSCWQFLNSARLRGRIQPWSAVDLTPEQVDPGDYLLDWRRGGTGLRYVHHFSPTELAEAARHAGFEIIESFPSDGEGGDLGLYQVWRPD